MPPLHARQLARSLAALVLAAPASGLADVAPARIALASTGSACPAATDVARKLMSIVPEVEIAASGQDAAGATEVVIVDEGPALLVRAGDASRRFRDPERGCERRLRWAAIFIALALEPPTTDLTPAAPAAAPSAPSAPFSPSSPFAPPGPPPSPASGAATGSSRVSASASATGSAWGLSVAALGRVGVAPWGALEVAWSGGPALRLAADHERFGVALGWAYLAPTRLRYPLLALRSSGSTVDLSARLHVLRGARVSLVVEAGAFVAAAGLSRSLPGGEADPQAVTLFDAGLRAAVQAEVRLARRLALVGGFDYLVSPVPIEITVRNDTPGRSAPAHWLSVAVGLSLSVF